MAEKTIYCLSVDCLSLFNLGTKEGRVLQGMGKLRSCQEGVQKNVRLPNCRQASSGCTMLLFVSKIFLGPRTEAIKIIFCHAVAQIRTADQFQFRCRKY